MGKKHIARLVIAGLILGDAALAAAGDGGTPATTVISIVGTNDLHGHIESLPLLAGALANLRAARARDGGVLLLDAGDMFQGTLESNLGEGAPVVRAYNALGYAAVAVGNHEFDFGPAGPDTAATMASGDPRGALKARASEAKFPFLVSNVIDEATGAPMSAPNIRASTMVKVAGLAIGVVGVTTMSTDTSTLASTFRGLRMQALVTAITREARLLRAQGAALVVVTAHAGASCQTFSPPEDLSSCAREQEIFGVARALPAGMVDAIVAGHTHAAVAHVVNGIPIIEAEEYGRAFARIDLEIDRGDQGRVKVVQATPHPPRHLCVDGGKAPACDAGSYEGAAVKADAAITALLAPDFARAAARKNEPLGVTVRAPFKRSYPSENALGNLVTDLMRAANPGADVAVTNGGGLRTDLPVGPLTYGTLFEVLPFDNTFAFLRLTGKQLREVVANNLGRGGGFLSISGVRAVARCTSSGLQVVTLSRPDGRAIADDEVLTLVTSNFLATGGDGSLAGLGARIEEAPTIRDAVAAVLRKRGGTLDGKDKTWFDRANPRVDYPGPRPVRCR